MCSMDQAANYTTYSNHQNTSAGCDAQVTVITLISYTHHRYSQQHVYRTPDPVNSVNTANRTRLC